MSIEQPILRRLPTRSQVTYGLKLVGGGTIGAVGVVLVLYLLEFAY